MEKLLYAQGQSPLQPSSGSPLGMFGTFIPLIVIFCIFYFLLILPQQKKQKEHKKMLEAIKEGDRVVTVGGALGQVKKIKDNVITLQFSEGVSIDYLRNAVSQVVKAGEQPKQE